MKRFLLSLLCLPLLLAACTTTDDDNPESGQPVIATFVYAVDPLVDFSSKTRSDGSVDEDIAEDTEIHDINLYVWPTDDPYSVIHKYQDSGRGVALPLAPGTYQVRIVANVGRDIGEMEPELLDQVGSSYLLTEEEQRRTLLFAAKKEITLTSTERMFNVELKRLFARTYVNVRVADALQSKITLVSAQVCNIPTTAALFGAPEGLTNCPAAVTCIHTSTVMRPVDNEITDLVYTYENLKPSNPAIKTQAQRGGSNVPTGATYVHIIANTPLGFYNYMIYLGENNTSNFTIRRNTSTRYDITIEGTNMVDLRVTTMFVCSLSGVGNRYDLKSWPTATSAAVFDYGKFGSYFSYPYMEGRCFMKIFADQYNFDNSANWIDSDKTSLTPLTSRYGYGIYLRGFGKNIPHPNYAKERLYDVYYGEPDALALQTFNSDGPRKYGYNINFKVEGMPYADFEVLDCKQAANVENCLDVALIYSADTGKASIFAYPDVTNADKPHFDFAFRWPSTYRFLGFYNKDGVQFNPAGAPISEGDVSWSTNGKGTTTAFWRDANKGSGDISLRFEKKPVVMEVQMSQTNKNSTCKLNRNKITLVDASRTAPVKMEVSCKEGEGTFLRNAKLNSTTGLYEGTAVTSYAATCAFLLGSARPADIVFVPFVAGNVSYKITISDLESGALIDEVTVENTIAKSAMELAFDFAISEADIKDMYLEYNTPSYVGYWRKQMGISPYKLYAYAVAKSGGGLEYWPSDLRLLFDTTIEYILAIRGLAAPDNVLIVSKDPALIKIIQRTCQLNICQDIKFEEAQPSSPAPPIIQEQALLDQYATLLFPLASDPDQVQNIGTPEVYAPDEAIRYDGSFNPYALYWRCRDDALAYMNIQATAPQNIRAIGPEVVVNLKRYGSNPALQHVPWWMMEYDSLKEKI